MEQEKIDLVYNQLVKLAEEMLCLEPEDLDINKELAARLIQEGQTPLQWINHIASKYDLTLVKDFTIEQAAAFLKRLQTPKIRVLVINPNDRTITEQHIEPTLQAYYKIIGCELVEVSYSGVIAQTDHFIFVDEEGTFKKEKNYFHIKDGVNPLTGIGILMKNDGVGNSISCEWTVEQLKPYVKFYSQQEILNFYRNAN